MADRFIYLDYAAATPLDDAVMAAMQPLFQTQFYNPSATYLPAQAVHKAIEAARAQVAHWLGARGSEIVFTAGGSEANNLAIHGVLRQHPDGNLVVSAIEHDSVLQPANRYAHALAPVGPDGIIDIDQLTARINDQTVLVSVMYANNEIGTIQPIGELSQRLQAIRAERTDGRPLYLHVDACQAANYLDLHVARLGVDLMTINGGKLYGPKQTGALYVRAGLQLQPLIDGGGQEFGLRSGTENPAGIVGFAAALETAQQMRASEVARLQGLQKQWLHAITQELPGAVVNGSLKRRLPNNVHLSMPGFDNERLLLQLESAGILAAAGSACSASDDEPSHVLRAIGLTDEMAQSSLRFTMGRATTAAQLETVTQTLKALTA